MSEWWDRPAAAPDEPLGLPLEVPMNEESETPASSRRKLLADAEAFQQSDVAARIRARARGVKIEE